MSQDNPATSLKKNHRPRIRAVLLVALATAAMIPSAMSGVDKGDAVGVGGNHRVFVTGQSEDTGDGYDIVTIGYNATTGAALWTRDYNGPADGDDAPWDLDVSADNTKVFVTGQVSVGGGEEDIVVLAYYANNGTLIWDETLDGTGSGDDSGSAVVASPDGDLVFVAGDTYSGATDGRDIIVAALDIDDGSLEWSYTYDGFDGTDDANALVVAPNGDLVFVAGGSDASGGPDDLIVIALDTSDGSQEWVNRYNGAGNGFDEARSIDVSPDSSRIVAAGQTTNSNGNRDYVARAFNSAGSVLWTSTYDGPAGLEDVANAISFSPNNTRVFVTGWSNTANGFDFYTIAYRAATGATAWAHRQDRGGNLLGDDEDFGYDLAVAPDGSDVYVLGTANTASPGTDYYTVAYDATNGGSPFCTVAYDANALDDHAASIAVRPNGNQIFVTGHSWGLNNNYDYATLSYDTADCDDNWVARYDGGDHDTIILDTP